MKKTGKKLRKLIEIKIGVAHKCDYLQPKTILLSPDLYDEVVNDDNGIVLKREDK